MATIYLSSTYEDLQEHRRVVLEALRKSAYHVIAMEDYVATDRRPVDECLKDVERADLYVGLFAFRYGYVPPPNHNNPKGLSITELEFRHAENLKKPCLTFIAKHDVGIPLDLVDAYSGGGEKGDQIERLRQYLLRERNASQFSAPHALANDVLAAVAKHLAEQAATASPAIEPRRQEPITWDIEKQGSPYPGLLHFTPKYAPVFFGRDTEIRTILDLMRRPEGRFILISGNSGVGKSSIVDAGVLPHLERTPLPGSTQCLCVRMVPSRGPHPFSALMLALHADATRAGLNPASIEKELITSPLRLAHHVRTILKGIDHDALALFLDQMEELFTAPDREASRAFLTALYQAAQEGALWVVATIRSDHLHHCHGHTDMLRVLRGSGHYPVGPIEPFLLSDLIVRPARRAGLHISDTLARHILHDMGAEGGHLPLLAFVLNELFTKRSNHELSEAVYAHVGGIKGAIAHHAATVERTIREERGAALAALLPTLFQSLVIVNAEGLPTRRRPLRSTFPSEMDELMTVLVRERLLHTEGEGNEATVSISHEALFEAWPSLKAYIAANRKQLMDQTLLESRARKWAEMGKPWFSGLASGREYKDFRRAGIPATATTTDYLRASHRMRSLLHGAIAVIIVLIGLITWLWQKGYSVHEAMLIAQSRFVSTHIEPEMRSVPAGTFYQGSHTVGNDSELPIHEVRIAKFDIGRYEVTFEEYNRFAIATGRPLPNDQAWGRGRRPVINVSSGDANAYATWLSQQTGKPYRLPTESEWEYAARSGGQDEVWAGTSDDKQLADYAVYAGNSQQRPAPVGLKKPNGLGLYDMSGNVAEWVQDCWHETYQGAPQDGSAWLKTGGGDCDLRVARGGTWHNLPVLVRSSFRGKDYVDSRNLDVGFRLMRDIP